MRDGFPKAPDSRDAVFGLLGGASLATEPQAPREAANGGPDGRALIGALYLQYCRALDDPHSTLAADWSAHVVVPREPQGAGPTSVVDYTHRPASSFESIETFLTGAYRMEHAFGPMGLQEAQELVATEPVPEILRLFAPAEYLAAAERRPATRPPALARREHHALGIDSPLSVPNTVHSMSSTYD